MFSNITSGAVFGIKSCLIQVEVDVSPGLPVFQIVGLPGSAVREAKERVKVALRNEKVKLPPMAININLSPADLPKVGTMFDLPMAIGIMNALELLDNDATDRTLLLGELGLNGEVKAVKGVLPIVSEAKRRGILRCIVPTDNVWEGRLVPGIEAVGVSGLGEAIACLKGQGGFQRTVTHNAQKGENGLPVGEAVSANTVADRLKVYGEKQENAAVEAPNLATDEYEGECSLDYADIHGQESLKRAAVVAAAGFHHLLIVGPPGAGKTMLAKRIPTILPPLTLDESLEVTGIYSIAGSLGKQTSLRKMRPFLNPHHTITRTALIGSGRIPTPGVVSMAHRGVLFLDELPEFKRETIDLLRQPLEDKEVQIARSTGTYVYPADFMLVAAMNPCPCGYYPDLNRCHCTPHEIRRYLGRVSGPMLDRMDICVEALPMSFQSLLCTGEEETSESMRQKVKKAREIQQQRFAGLSIQFNGEMGTKEVEQFCVLGEAEKEFMNRIFQTMALSPRSYHKILRVARTIADLEASERIQEIHLTEAVCFRQANNTYWR